METNQCIKITEQADLSHGNGCIPGKGGVIFILCYASHQVNRNQWVDCIEGLLYNPKSLERN